MKLLNISTPLSLISLFSTTEQKPLQKRTNPLEDGAFKALANDQINRWHVPGIAISIVDGNDTWAQGYGISQFPSTPVTPETLFFGGSTTKAFTAAALARLIASGNHTGLSWKTPVGELIRDDFVLEDVVRTGLVTVEDVLSHRTGMPRHDISYGGSDPKTSKSYTPRDLVRNLRYLPLTAGLRERFQYCNMMYVVASYVVETLSGVWLGDFLKREIWGKLGMNATYFSNEDALAAPEPLAKGYVYTNSTYVEVPYMDLTSVSGAGSIISNVLDYSKWVRSLLTLTGPLSPSSIRELLTPRTIVLEKEPWLKGPKAYALGWINGNYRGYEYFEHSGGMEAFGAQVIFFPDLNYGITAFGNTGVTSNYAELSLIWRLIDDKLNVPASERFDWDEFNTAQLKYIEQIYDNAQSIYYPNIPSPPLPLSRPLSNYTGTYFHPAYHNITLTLNNTSSVEQLYALREATWVVYFTLKHISGDYFIAYVESTKSPGLIFRQAVPAEFKISADGVVDRFGIAAEPEMGIDGRIWFDRIA